VCASRLRRRLGRSVTIALLVTVSAVVSAATQKDHPAEQFGVVPAGARIVFMRPDIKLFVVSDRGTVKPRPDWVDAAQRSFNAALQAYASSRELNAVSAQPDADSERYERLYTVVADTILTHHIGLAPLPTKGTTFDWTLGPDIAVLGERYRADYGLFITYRSYRAASGKWANQVAGAVMLRVPTGSEVASAALVDMRSGAIVWFNPFNANGMQAGDIRNSEDATSSVTRLLDEWPRS
jgi:hypothetical protein